MNMYRSAVIALACLSIVGCSKPKLEEMLSASDCEITKLAPVCSKVGFAISNNSNDSVLVDSIVLSVDESTSVDYNRSRPRIAVFLETGYVVSIDEEIKEYEVERISEGRFEKITEGLQFPANSKTDIEVNVCCLEIEENTIEQYTVHFVVTGDRQACHLPSFHLVFGEDTSGPDMTRTATE